MYGYWDYIPKKAKFTPSFQLQTRERRLLTDSTRRIWSKVSDQREKIVRFFTLSADEVHVIETELNDLEKERAKPKTSAVITTDVVDLLKRSNQRPTSDQVSVLKTLLVQKNSELAKIESDVLRLQLKINDDFTAMKELERLKAEKQAEANYYESWLFSVRLLPSEVLIRIFQYSISYHGSSSKRRTTPLSLSHVCSAWRNSALACSSLWNDLELNLSKFHTKPNHIGLLLDLWYGRANCHSPLSLSLKDDQYAHENLAINFASHITKFSPRMSTVSVELHGCLKSSAAFLVSPGGSFPNLESLMFTITDSKVERDISLITVFDLSPCLRIVTLRTPGDVLEGRHRLFLPWNQLTHLHMGGPLSIQSFALIFFQSTQLQVASFHNINLADQSDAPQPILPPSPIEFPHLKDLRIRLNGPFLSYDISGVLEMMLLPNVRNLDLAGYTSSFSRGHGHFFPVGSILPPPSNGFPPIRHLLLAYADISRDKLLEILAVCPSLENLTLCLDTIHPITLVRDLSRIMPSGSSNPVTSLSNLTSFTFACIISEDEKNGNAFDTDGFIEAFTALITSWITDPNRHCPLRKISLFVCHATDTAFIFGYDNIYEITRIIEGRLQDNFASLLDDSVFTASRMCSYEELLSIFGFEVEEDEE